MKFKKAQTFEKLQRGERIQQNTMFFNMRMGGQRNNHGKRSNSYSDFRDNKGSKRSNSGEEREAYAPGPEDTVYRYLCPAKKIGSIIGRGGEIVKQLRADTRAKIRIGETLPGCDERVVSVFSSSEETNTLEDTGKTVCAAQDALFRVHERVISDEDVSDGDADASAPQVTVRLLVPSDQIGCIIGKGGQIIQGIRSSTGAQIRILKNEHLPPCANSTDELLQIIGDAAVVKKALSEVSSQLHENPSRTQHMLFSNNNSQYRTSAGPLISSYEGYKGDATGDWPPFYSSPRDESSTKEFTLRMICPSESIGGVIGKGGVIIKQIRQDSGAYIKVDSSNAEDDCIITISAKELFEDPFSSTIDAAVRLQPRCSEKVERDSGEPSFTTRLLVSTSRIGCLIGKGGSIITEMRRNTRANIRVLPKENLPKVASDDDEMVQISGDLDVCRDALIQIATRLKANIFEREGALSGYAPLSYHSMPSDLDNSKYGSRDSRATDRGYSYSGDLHSSGGYPSSQVGGSNYGTYDAYRRRSGSAGLSGPSPVSHGKHYGY